MKKDRIKKFFLSNKILIFFSNTSLQKNINTINIKLKLTAAFPKIKEIGKKNIGKIPIFIFFKLNEN